MLSELQSQWNQATTQKVEFNKELGAHSVMEWLSTMHVLDTCIYLYWLYSVQLFITIISSCWLIWVYWDFTDVVWSIGLVIENAVFRSNFSLLVNYCLTLNIEPQILPPFRHTLTQSPPLCDSDCDTYLGACVDSVSDVESTWPVQ